MQRKLKEKDNYSNELASAFRNDLFNPYLLSWMKANDPREYMPLLPEDMQEIWIPCDVFVKHFGSMHNKRSKLMDMMEALPPQITKINLDGMVVNKVMEKGKEKEYVRVFAFQLRRLLDALKPVTHIQHINLTSNQLFMLRTYRRHPDHIANNLFNMLMRGIAPNVTSLDLSRNDPFPDFTSSWEIKPLLAKVEAKRIGPRRKNPLREETINKYRAKIIADLKDKLSKIPEQIERIDLSYNYLYKFGVDGLMEILNVLLEKPNLKYIKLAGNLIQENLGDNFLKQLSNKLEDLQQLGRTVPIISCMENDGEEKEFLEHFDSDVDVPVAWGEDEIEVMSESDDETSLLQNLGLFDNDLDSLADYILAKVEDKANSPVQRFGLFAAPKQVQPGMAVGVSAVRMGEEEAKEVAAPRLM